MEKIVTSAPEFVEQQIENVKEHHSPIVPKGRLQEGA